MAVINFGRVAPFPRGQYSALTEYSYLDWVTDSGSSYVYINHTPEAGDPLVDTSHWQQIAAQGTPGDVVAQAQLDDINLRIDAMASGKPTPAATAAAMTDADKAYLYTGTEGGYENGHIYYHNGTSFVDSGIVYQATEIADGSVFPNKTSFADEEVGTNLFDDSKKSPNAGNNGYVADPVAIPSNSIILISTGGNNYSYITSIICYDEDMTVLTAPTTTNVPGTPRSGKYFTSAADCAYVAFTYRTTSAGGDLCYDMMVEVLAAAPSQPLSPYEKYIKTYKLKNNSTVYVSPTGSDDNSGLDSLHPLLTFSKALNLGADTIYAKRGVYIGETVYVYGKKSIKIMPYDNGETYAHASPNRQQIVINGGQTLTSLVDNGGILSQAYGGALLFNEVFIAQSQTLMAADNPRVVVWQQFADASLDARLVPKLTLAEVEATAGTFTWDGTTIYIHPYAGTPTSFVCHSALSGLRIVNCKEVHLEDVEVRYAGGSNFAITNCADAYLRNCKASYSNQSEGFDVDNSNVDFHRCIAFKSSNDGFNIHGYGETNFYGCRGLYCYGDGMSHHDGCTGEVHGGEYSGNGQGGITPAYGAQVNIYNALCKGNAVFGIGYLTTPNGHAPMVGYISGCALVGNPTGLTVYPLAAVKASNIAYSGNIADKNVTGTLSEY